MKALKNYLESLVRSFNPISYRHLSERARKHAFGYFFMTIFLATIIMSLFTIPKLFMYSNSIDSIVDKIDLLDTDINIKTSEPIKIDLPSRIFFDSDFIIVDTTGTVLPNQTSVLIDENFIYYNNGQNRRELSEATELLQYKDNFRNFLQLMIIVFFPSFLLISFIGYSLIFLVAIAIISFIAKTVLTTKNSQSQLSFMDIVNVGLYASTFLVFGMIAKPIIPQYNNYLYLLFPVYFILGLVLAKKRRRQ